jgi:hypothetical protein
MGHLYGLYIGMVAGGADPQQQGRVRVTIPSVAGGATMWARVCTSAGRATGQAVVGFEGGDAARPIVLGYV